ncbi:hypothetical protein GOP47_0022285 [Adiantum capillus-veneris]|uniref:Uncharacterized protein n=1 Tax=Adiantum capillus-veneris TaxID=13818 RepID=A0A9D4UA08_ADICA|nr:hypothetical protein GOP47_0022285 [Adiantum capillus-veneris]
MEEGEVTEAVEEVEAMGGANLEGVVGGADGEGVFEGGGDAKEGGVGEGDVGRRRAIDRVEVVGVVEQRVPDHVVQVEGEAARAACARLSLLALALACLQCR